MKPLSIRARLILSLNALALALGVGAGWISIHWVNRSVVQRALQDPACNAARLIPALRLPLSDRLAEDVARMTGCATAFVDPARHHVLGTSLPSPERAELAARLATLRVGERVTLAGTTYALGMADIAGPSAPGRVLQLLPVEELAAEARRAARRIAAVTLAGTLATTLLGAWVSYSVTRPLRRLAEEAAGMGAGIEIAAPGADARRPPATPDATGSGLRRRFAETEGPTEVTSLAHSFNQLLARLEEAHRGLDHVARLAAVGQLAASVVHEIRNPLCGIAMNARVLAEEATRHGQPDPSLDLIAREVDRIDLYLKELLTLAGAPAEPAAEGSSRAAAAPAAEVRAVVGSVAALVGGRCRHTGVALDWALPDGEAWVRIDATRLRQVLLNLVLNALDAMPEGGRLWISGRAGDAAGTFRLEVTDTGPGVSLAAGQDPFAPFVTTKPGSCGLGLHVSRRLVEESGGRIGYEARGPGGPGTCFWVELPGLAAAGAQAEIAPPHGKAAPLSGQG